MTVGKHHGVDKMFWLEPGPLSSTTTNVVYLCRPLIRNIKIVAGKSRNFLPENHPCLMVSAGRPDQETRKGISETFVHAHTCPASFDFGQSDLRGGRRIGRGKNFFV